VRGLLTATAMGARDGRLIGLMRVLAHGREARRHLLHVLPPSVVSGAIIGVLVADLQV